jgi:transposase
MKRKEGKVRWPGCAYRKVGVGDPLTWKAIQTKKQEAPEASTREIADELGVSKSLADKVVQREAQGETAPGKNGGGSKSVTFGKQRTGI